MRRWNDFPFRRPGYGALNRLSKRGLTLIEMALVIAIGFGLLVGALAFAHSSAQKSLIRDRAGQIIMISNEVRAVDRDFSMVEPTLHISIRLGDIGFVPIGMAEGGAMVGAHSVELSGGMPSKYIHFIYQDQDPGLCEAMRYGLRTNSGGVSSGYSSLLGNYVFVRCGISTDGRQRTSIVVPYQNVGLYIRQHGGYLN